MAKVKHERLVFILSNESMPGLLKIGFTKNSPEYRAQELYQTGLPFPFVVQYKVYTPNPYVIEQRAHRKLAEYRVAKNREFFCCDLFIAVNAVDECCNLSEVKRLIRSTAKKQVATQKEEAAQLELKKTAIINKHEPKIAKALQAAKSVAEGEKNSLKVSSIIFSFIAFMLGDGNWLLGWSVFALVLIRYLVVSSKLSDQPLTDKSYLEAIKLMDKEIENLE